MFFVPVAILVIEDEDDRTFMENLYSSYHRLMYHTIHLITEDPEHNRETNPKFRYY